MVQKGLAVKLFILIGQTVYYYWYNCLVLSMYTWLLCFPGLQYLHSEPRLISVPLPRKCEWNLIFQSHWFISPKKPSACQILNNHNIILLAVHYSQLRWHITGDRFSFLLSHNIVGTVCSHNSMLKLLHYKAFFFPLKYI